MTTTPTAAQLTTRRLLTELVGNRNVLAALTAAQAATQLAADAALAQAVANPTPRNLAASRHATAAAEAADLAKDAALAAEQEAQTRHAASWARLTQAERDAM